MNVFARTKKMKISKDKIKEIEKAFMSISRHRAKEDVVPKGFFTKNEYSEVKKVSRCTGERHLGQLFRLNKVEMKKFRIKYASGVRAVEHYRYV